MTFLLNGRIGLNATLVWMSSSSFKNINLTIALRNSTRKNVIEKNDVLRRFVGENWEPPRDYYQFGITKIKLIEQKNRVALSYLRTNRSFLILKLLFWFKIMSWKIIWSKTPFKVQFYGDVFWKVLCKINIILEVITKRVDFHQQWKTFFGDKVSKDQSTIFLHFGHWVTGHFSWFSSWFSSWLTWILWDVWLIGK